VVGQQGNLNYVKSDISTDKTVCDVSGNFMSARADERIAAHYAGKQYVGGNWCGTSSWRCKQRNGGEYTAAGRSPIRRILDHLVVVVDTAAAAATGGGGG
jgi:hypothetical protein